MATIFDIVKSEHIASYWNTLGDESTHITAELFPVAKQIGLNLKWIKGSKGRPVVLKASAFDAHAIPRAQIGFAQIQNEMPYFKESTYTDEELRQQLNQVLATDNQVYIDSVMMRVFDDEMRLLRGAAARREQMRTMVLSTGVISMVSNGQDFTFDYGVEHKVNAAVSWSDPNSDPFEYIRIAKEAIQAETGEVLTRAMCDEISWKNLRGNNKIRQSIFNFTPGTGGIISDRILKSFILDEMGLEVIVNNHRYCEENGEMTRYVPENTFVMFPAGPLGNTWFGTTPAESDLACGHIANVSIVDTGDYWDAKPYYLKDGQWIAHKPYYADIMQRFLSWMDEGKYTAHGEVFDAGIATQQALQRFRNGIDPLECGGTSEQDNGNGSLIACTITYRPPK